MRFCWLYLCSVTLHTLLQAIRDHTPHKHQQQNPFRPVKFDKQQLDRFSLT